MSMLSRLGPVTALAVAAALCGCAGPAQHAADGTPDYCSVNNTAAGGVVGAAGGAAIGAAMGGGPLRSLIGAAAGGVAGGAMGAQADEECRQLALRRAYERAAAQQAALEQVIAQQAAYRPGPLQLPPAAYEPIYEDYATPSNGHRHRITVKRLSSYAEPATKQVCDNFTRLETDMDGNTTTTVSARRCKGPDGAWRDA